MKIIEKFQKKTKDLWNAEPVTIAFLGDSVTQGCFELYCPEPDKFETEFRAEHAYHTDLRKIFNLLYPNVPLNIINAGISGDNAPHGAERLDRDVLRFNPDLCVVCFGLNDTCDSDPNALENYKKALDEIMTRLHERGIEVIFMTPNMMCHYVSNELTDQKIRETADIIQGFQNAGKLAAYLEEAKKIAGKHSVPVCDCYAKWIALQKGGVDTVRLLANRINHPRPEMDWMFAYSLVETMFRENA